MYLAIVIPRLATTPASHVHYAATLLWITAASVAVSVAIRAGFETARPSEDHRRDVRDREIGRLGERVGQSFVVIGAVAAMLMAMAGWDRFWIANVIYLSFALSVVLGGITKVIAYRKPFPQW